MSGGSNDDATLGIAHRDKDGCVWLDRVVDQGQRPPFDPRRAVERFVAVLREYGLKLVVGDAYAGETFRQDFQRLNISYRISELSKSEIYEEMEPLLNGGRVVLLDNTNLESQFLGLVWRANKIDHQNGEHDDWANAAAGAIYLASEHKVLNLHAAPIGVGKNQFWGSPRDRAMLQPFPNSTYGPAPAEERPNTGCAELYHSPFSYFGRKKD